MSGWTFQTSSNSNARCALGAVRVNHLADVVSTVSNGLGGGLLLFHVAHWGWGAVTNVTTFRPDVAVVISSWILNIVLESLTVWVVSAVSSATIFSVDSVFEFSVFEVDNMTSVVSVSISWSALSLSHFVWTEWVCWISSRLWCGLWRSFNRSSWLLRKFRSCQFKFTVDLLKLALLELIVKDIVLSVKFHEFFGFLFLVIIENFWKFQFSVLEPLFFDSVADLFLVEISHAPDPLGHLFLFDLDSFLLRQFNSCFTFSKYSIVWLSWLVSIIGKALLSSLHLLLELNFCHLSKV